MTSHDLPIEEVRRLLEEDKKVKVTCQKCGLVFQDPSKQFLHVLCGICWLREFR